MSRVLTMTAACALLLSSSALAGQGKAASVGIFPLHRTSIFTGESAFTVISLTNTNLHPTQGQTLVHYEYVNVLPNPASPFLPLGCTILDRLELLTPADTLSVLASCHNAVGSALTEGYLVVTAMDPDLFLTPWSFNHLVGSELVISGSGAAISLNMLPFRSPLAQGQQTDLDNDGQLDFDGVEYEGVPDRMIIDSFIALADSHLTLLNLTGGARAQNTILFSIWNDNEFPLSSTLTFNCWFDAPLESVSFTFNETFLAENTPNDPNELSLACGGQMTLETGWALIQSLVVIDPATMEVISTDGAFLGAISSGPSSIVDGGRPLWQTQATQTNGAFFSF